MNTDQAIDYCTKCLEWINKEQPDNLTEERLQTIGILRNRRLLERKHRMLLGFSLFKYSILAGEHTHTVVSECADILGILDETIYYATTFLDSCHSREQFIEATRIAKDMLHDH